MLEELLELTCSYPGMLLNLELKDYPHVEGEEWAYETADKTIEMVEKYDLSKRIIFNSFSGKLLSYIDKKYNKRYALHGYYPHFILGQDRGDPSEYLNVACLFHCEMGADGKTHNLEGQVCPQEWFDDLISRNIEPWVGAGVKTYDDLKACFDLGARLVTTDNPAETLELLRKMGHHK